MVHHFNIELATKYGIEEAILIENIYFWISKNGANKVHLHEGRYWTYNSRKAFADLFPYINESKIRRAFGLLCNGKIDIDSKEYVIKPILIKGNFNKTDFDQTNWYAFSDYGIETLKELKYDIKNLCQNEPMDWSKIANGDAQNDQPIPDNKPDRKHKENKDKSLFENDNVFADRMYDMYPAKCPCRKASLGKCHKDKDKIRKLLKLYTKEQIELVFKNEIASKYGISWMSNLSTFLNNFPDPACIDTGNQNSEESETSTKEGQFIKNGIVYR